MPDNSSLHSNEQPSLDQNSGSVPSPATGTLPKRSFGGYNFGDDYDVDDLPSFDIETDLLLRQRHPVNQELTGTPEEKLKILREKLDQ